jgi:hypothetical protein
MRPLWIGFHYGLMLLKKNPLYWVFTFYYQSYKDTGNTGWDITIRILGLTIIIRR